MAVVVVRDRRTRVRRRRPVHAQARRRCGLHRRRARLARRLATHVRHRHRDRLRGGLLPCPRAARRRHLHHVLVVASDIGRIDTLNVLGVLEIGRRLERQHPGRRPDREETLVRPARDRVARDVVLRTCIADPSPAPCQPSVWFSAASNVAEELNDGAALASVDHVPAARVRPAPRRRCPRSVRRPHLHVQP